MGTARVQFVGMHVVLPNVWLEIRETPLLLSRASVGFIVRLHLPRPHACWSLCVDGCSTCRDLPPFASLTTSSARRFHDVNAKGMPYSDTYWAIPPFTCAARIATH